jgi:hypothetical protein
MSSCDFIPDTLFNNTIPWSQISSLFSNTYPCVDNSISYLRPDVAGSLMPWLFATILLFVHLPTAIMRTIRWERVQWLTIAVTLFECILYVTSMVSTRLDPAKVLVWSPLMLALDAGAMLHIFVLKAEANKSLSSSRRFFKVLFSCRSQPARGEHNLCPLFPQVLSFIIHRREGHNQYAAR